MRGVHGKAGGDREAPEGYLERRVSGAPVPASPPKKAELNKVAQQSGAREAQHALVMGSGPGVSLWTPPHLYPAVLRPPGAGCAGFPLLLESCWAPLCPAPKSIFLVPETKTSSLAEPPGPGRMGSSGGGSSWPSPPWSWAFWGGPRG